MSMEMKVERSPSFFKVAIMDFTRKLSIPPDFMRKYGLKLSENVTLRINSGKTWNVKVEKMEDENYHFTQGWNKFVHDVGLEVGEFVFFMLVGKSMFDVSIFGTSACEREINPASKFQDGKDSGDDEVDIATDVINNKQSKTLSGGGSSKSVLYFEVILKQHQRSRLTLTKSFWSAAGLKGKKTVGLEYLPKHRYQTVAIDHRPKRYRLDLAAGWPKFRKANRLVFGRTYSFEFKPRKNVIQVQEVKREK